MSTGMILRAALESAAKQLDDATEDKILGEDVMYLVGCMRAVSKKCRDALAATATPEPVDGTVDAKATRDCTGTAGKEPPPVFKVGDRVDWTDPSTGDKTGMWTVLDAPEIPAEGPSGDEVYTIVDYVLGWEIKAHARELSYSREIPL